MCKLHFETSIKFVWYNPRSLYEEDLWTAEVCCLLDGSRCFNLLFCLIRSEFQRHWKSSLCIWLSVLQMLPTHPKEKCRLTNITLLNLCSCCLGRFEQFLYESRSYFKDVSSGALLHVSIGYLRPCWTWLFRAVAYFTLEPLRIAALNFSIFIELYSVWTPVFVILLLDTYLTPQCSCSWPD